MSNTLISNSKLMYYPTQDIETYKMLPLFGEINLQGYEYCGYIKEVKEKIKKDMGEKDLKEIEINALDKNTTFKHELYYYLLKNNRLDLIKKYFIINFQTNNNNQLVICDYFAGEGKWLKTFKDFLPNKNDNIYLIGNELEQNRYNTLIKDNLINEYTNLPFEKLQLPKNHASLILFNPPYGSTNKIRNAKYYLQMILDRKYIYNNVESHNNGSIICVLRKEDILDCSELLVRNFQINYNLIYKVNDEEYSKYKQLIIIGKLRKSSLTDNRCDNYLLDEGVCRLKEKITQKKEFSSKFYELRHFNQLHSICYKSIKENFKYVINKEQYISNNDDTWNWIKEMTQIENLSMKKIIIPKNLKIGELSLLISSGYINGNLNLNKKAKHIAIGGVKNLEITEYENKKDSKGKNYVEVQTIRKTQPYLNLLINNKGKIQIKELGGDN